MNKHKELRSERNLSVRGMEIKTGIKYNTYSRYESGERDMSTDVLRQLAKFFEVTIDYLLCNNTFCIYAKYEKGSIEFVIREEYYTEIKKYIYFDDDDKRCIDLNSLIGVNKDSDITELLIEFVRIAKMDALFEKKVVNQSDIDDLDKEIYKIELNRGLIERIKDAIR